MVQYLTSWPLAEAIGITFVFGLTARLLGTVSNSGFVGGVVVGSLIYYFSGWPGFVVLGVFFILASALTKLGYRRKSELGAAQSDSGRRGASHAAANCAAGALLAVGYKLSGGGMIWAAGFTASFATAAADTAGSEIGPLTSGKTYLATTFKQASPGTPGAISLYGTLAGVLVSAVIALVGYSTGFLAHPGLIASVVIAAVAAAWVESVLGGIPIMERALGNEILNLINTVLGAVFCMAMVAMV